MYVFFGWCQLFYDFRSLAGNGYPHAGVVYKSYLDRKTEELKAELQLKAEQEKAKLQKETEREKTNFQKRPSKSLLGLSWTKNIKVTNTK